MLEIPSALPPASQSGGSLPQAAAGADWAPTSSQEAQINASYMEWLARGKRPRGEEEPAPPSFASSAQEPEPEGS